MNAVSNLTFTVETVHDFKNKMLPTLDLQVEVIKAEYKKRRIDQISFTFFQKPMKTPLVIGSASAMATNQKHNILSNEVVKRLSNEVRTEATLRG